MYYICKYKKLNVKFNFKNAYNFRTCSSGNVEMLRM